MKNKLSLNVHQSLTINKRNELWNRMKR